MSENTYKRKNEYGGYLPIELRTGKDYFENFSPLRFNCANAAIDFILEHNSFSKIYVPYYMCPNICANIDSKNLIVEYYHISDKLVPVCDFEDEDGICIYITDYFGVMKNKTNKLVARYKKASIIFDLCHSFFHEPIMADNVFNIYSARKFFGVPDGSYLVCKKYADCSFVLKENYSSAYSSYLLTSVEYGTDYAYEDKKNADSVILDNKGAISELSKKILCSIDYDSVYQIRKQNAETYHSILSKINQIEIEPNSIPYIYPLNCEKNIKKQLIEEKIYVPTLWGHLLNDRFKNSIEYRFSEETLFLPLDQRYNKEDIEFIASVVKKYL